MTYDPNSPEARKGDWAEEAVIEYLGTYGYRVVKASEFGLGAALMEIDGRKRRFPDLVAMKEGRTYLIEVKYKAKFGSWGKLGKRVQCIDLMAWRDYLAVARESGHPLQVFIAVEAAQRVYFQDAFTLESERLQGDSGHESRYGGKVQAFFPADAFSYAFPFADVSGTSDR